MKIDNLTPPGYPLSTPPLACAILSRKIAAFAGVHVLPQTLLEVGFLAWQPTNGHDPSVCHVRCAVEPGIEAAANVAARGCRHRGLDKKRATAYPYPDPY